MINTMAQSEELNTFKQQLEKDWGNPEIYGPWTKKEDMFNKDGSLKFFKSFYMITDNRPAQLDAIVNPKTGELDLDYFRKTNNEPIKIKFMVPVGQKRSFWDKIKFW